MTHTTHEITHEITQDASEVHDLIPFPALTRHLEGLSPDLSARIHEVDPESAVAGFRFGGIHAGVKKRAGQLDLGLIIADRGAACAGVYTQNLVVAAPVTLSRAHLAERAWARAVVVNSGNANACTGAAGARDALHVTEQVAALLSTPESPIARAEIQVASTGVIGAPLPTACITDALDALSAACTPKGLPRFAESIMTTDNRPKTRALKLDLRGITGANGVDEVTISGCSKGAGMIHPNMATMLAYVCTDAPLPAERLQPLWRRVCDQSFNAITIDGDTSTNDTALCLASGAAGESALSDEALELFELTMRALAQALAVDIVRDGEGVEHVARLTVRGAASVADARRVAETVGLSPLVKTAMNGCDPNWGRIIAAVGRSGVEIDPERISLAIGGVMIFQGGEWRGVKAEDGAHQAMLKAEYDITLDLELGSAHTTLFMSDFSASYVKINADYRS